MGMDGYLDRIKQAKKAAQERILSELPRAKELLDKSVAATTSASAKAATAVSEGYALASSKAKSAVDSDEAKFISAKLKEVGEIASQSLSTAGEKTKELMRKPAVSIDEPNSEHKIQNAISKLSSKDKVGIAGEQLSAVGGAVAGVAVAGTVASVAGATTLFGSSALAGVFGGIFVTATPVGWVLGSAALMGAAGYGIAKMIRSGSEQDQQRKQLIQRLTERLADHQHQQVSVDCRVELSQLLALTVAAEALSEESAIRMVSLVEAGSLMPELALERIKSIASSKGIIVIEHP